MYVDKSDKIFSNIKIKENCIHSMEDMNTKIEHDYNFYNYTSNSNNSCKEILLNHWNHNCKTGKEKELRNTNKNVCRKVSDR